MLLFIVIANLFYCWSSPETRYLPIVRLWKREIKQIRNTKTTIKMRANLSTKWQRNLLPALGIKTGQNENSCQCVTEYLLQKQYFAYPQLRMEWLAPWDHKILTKIFVFISKLGERSQNAFIPWLMRLVLDVYFPAERCLWMTVSSQVGEKQQFCNGGISSITSINSTSDNRTKHV